MNNNEQVLKLAIHRLMNSIKILAESCNTLDSKWYKYECYFRLTEDDGIDVDSFILADSDKVCRRRFPRIQVRGKEITFNKAKKVTKNAK